MPDMDAAFAKPCCASGNGSPGLSKREYYAAIAMQGIIGNPDNELVGSVKEAAELVKVPVEKYRYDIHYPQIIAIFAVRQADALIAELSKEGK